MFNLVNRARKKNNKGFSLVELIVVVLIIAIIAVALAPQVMKWVGTSKGNVDDNNLATLKSAVSAGIADYQSTATTTSVGACTITVTKGATSPAVSWSGSVPYQTNVNDAVDQWPNPQGVNNYEIRVDQNGKVTVSKS